MKSPEFFEYHLHLVVVDLALHSRLISDQGLGLPLMSHGPMLHKKTSLSVQMTFFAPPRQWVTIYKPALFESKKKLCEEDSFYNGNINSYSWLERGMQH